MNLFSKFKSKFSKIALSFSLLLGTLAGAVGISSVGYAASRAGISGWDIAGCSTSTSGDASWTYGKNGNFSGSVTGTTTGKFIVVDWEKTGKLIIKNTSFEKANVSFEYSVAKTGDGSFSIDGNDSSKNGVISRDLPLNNTVEISIMGKGKKGTTTVNITNFKLTDKSKISNITFASDPNGTVSVTQGTENIDLDKELEFSSGTEFALRAVPNSGYYFLGWNVNNVISSADSDWSFVSPVGTSVISPLFSTQQLGIFSVNGALFSDLNEAVSAAANASNKNVIVYKNGIVPNGQYSITSGVTLVVPMDDAGSNVTFDNLKDKFTSNGGTTPSLFRELFLSSGCLISVEDGASISVCSRMNAGSGGQAAGNPVGPYGMITMGNDSKIILKKGAKLNCFGFISGSGKVTAESGSTVYEMFQIGYFRGGNKTISMLGKSEEVFIFNQYYVQNIMATLCLEYGAEEICPAAVYMSGFTNFTSLIFIGSGSNGMFRLSNEGSYITKRYDAGSDRLLLEVHGNGNLSSVSVSLSLYTVKSNEYVLPITSNIDITVCSGSTISLNQDFAFLPGSKMTVEKGATVNVSSGCTVYMYGSLASGQWGNYAGGGALVNAPYIPGKHKQRANSDLVNSCFDINGSLSFENNAFCYSTFDSTTKYCGGEIISSGGTGSVTFSSVATSESKTYQLQNNSDYVEIPVVQAQLQNAISSKPKFTVDTSCAGKEITYYVDQWVLRDDVPQEITVVFKNDDGEEYAETRYKTNLFVFPTSDVIMQQANWKIYSPIFLWKNAESGEIYKPNERVTNAKKLDGQTFLAFMGGWLYDSKANKTYYYEAKDSIGMVTGLYAPTPDNEHPFGTYLFDNKGALQNADILLYENPGDQRLYLTKKGVVQKDYGMLQYFDSASRENHYYYFGENGYAYKSGTYHLSSNKLNGYFAEGSFTFDSNGVLTSFTSDASFSVGEGGSLNNNVFTLDGVKAGVGLFTLSSDNHVYYAKDDGSIAKNETIYVSKTNGIKDSSGNAIEEGLYWFNASGYMFDASYQTMQKGA